MTDKESEIQQGGLLYVLYAFTRLSWKDLTFLCKCSSHVFTSPYVSMSHTEAKAKPAFVQKLYGVIKCKRLVSSLCYPRDGSKCERRRGQWSSMSNAKTGLVSVISASL